MTASPSTRGRSRYAASGGDRGPGAASILSDSFVTFICRVVSLLGSLALSITTARFLGPAGRGVAALPMIDASIAGATFVGLTSGVSYLLLKRRTGRAGIWAVFVALIPIVGVGSMAVLALGILGAHPSATLYALASLPFTAIICVAQGACYGTHRTRLANYIGAGLIAVTLSGTLLGFAVAGVSPRVVILAWLVSQIVVATAGLVVIGWIARDLVPGRMPLRTALGFCTKTGLVNLVTLLNYRADIYIVALFTSPALLGIYTLAVAGAEATHTVTQSVATATAPHVGSLPLDQARVLTARAARNNIFIAVLMCIAIAVVAPLLIPLLFGTTFRPIVAPLRILLLGIVAVSSTGVFSNYFTLARGKPEWSMAIGSAGALVSIGLSLQLVPRLGLTGAAIAVTSSYFLSASASIALFCRDTRTPLLRTVVIGASDLRVYSTLADRLVRRLRGIARPA